MPREGEGQKEGRMKLEFRKEDWEELLENIDFTYNEKKIIPLLRRVWYQVDISAELNISVSTVKRRITSITNKTVSYIMRTRKINHN